MDTNAQIDEVLRCLAQISGVLERLRPTPDQARDRPQVSRIQRLLTREKWPRAFPPSNFDPNSDHDRHQRAMAILDVVLERSIAGKKFLDLRCGNGDILYAAAMERPALAMGYDHRPGGWERFPGLLLTTDLSLVQESGPYDAILLQDYIDACLSPQAVLAEARELCAPDGLIYLSCRPWSSRQGLGECETINKAYCQLYLPAHELKDLGVESIPRQRVVRVATYRDWIAQAGLGIRREQITRTPVEPIFRTPVMLGPLLDLYGVEEFPEDDLSVTSVRYTLYRKP